MNKNEEIKKHETAEPDQGPSQPKKRDNKESTQEQRQQKERTRKKRKEKEPAQEKPMQEAFGQESTDKKKHDAKRKKHRRKEHDKGKRTQKKREGKKSSEKEPAPEECTQKTSSAEPFKETLRLPTEADKDNNRKRVEFSKENPLYRYIEKEGKSRRTPKDKRKPNILMSDCDDSDLLNIRYTVARVERERYRINNFLNALSAGEENESTREYLLSLIKKLDDVEEVFVELRNSRRVLSDEERKERIRLRNKEIELSDEDKGILEEQILYEQDLYAAANIALRGLKNAISENKYREVRAKEKRKKQKKGAIISRGNEIIEDGVFVIEKPAGNISRDDIPIAAAFAEILRGNFFLISHACKEMPQRSQQIIKDITLTSLLSKKGIKIPGKITLYLKNNDPNQILYARASNAFLRYMLEYSSYLTERPYGIEIINEQGLLQPGDLLSARIRAKEEEALAGNVVAISSSSSSNSDSASSPESDEDFDPEEGSSSSSGRQEDDEGASASSSGWQEEDEGASSSSSVWQSPTPFFRAARSEPDERGLRTSKEFGQ